MRLFGWVSLILRRFGDSGSSSSGALSSHIILLPFSLPQIPASEHGASSDEALQFSRESALKTNIRLSVFPPVFFSSAAHLWPAEILVQKFRGPTFVDAVDFSIAEPGQFQKFCFEGIKVNMFWGRVGGGGVAEERGGGGAWVKGRSKRMGR